MAHHVFVNGLQVISPTHTLTTVIRYSRSILINFPVRVSSTSWYGLIRDNTHSSTSRPRGCSSDQVLVSNHTYVISFCARYKAPQFRSFEKSRLQLYSLWNASVRGSVIFLARAVVGNVFVGRGLGVSYVSSIALA